MRSDRSRRFGADDRAVSVTVGYVLNLAVATLLLSGLFVAGGSFVENQREDAVEGQLTVIGERIAADLMTVDRLASSAASPSDLAVEREATLPSRVSGTGYRVSIVANGTSGTIQLESQRADVVVEIPFRTSEDVTVANSTVAGGTVRIAYEWAADPPDGEEPKRVVVRA